MSNWQDKSDDEINRAVAIAHGLDVTETPDYCNSPNDVWPIIVETCMTIELAHPELGQVGTNIIYNPFGTDWSCDYTDNKDCFRAAMIVYLEMKENE